MSQISCRIQERNIITTESLGTLVEASTPIRDRTSLIFPCDVVIISCGQERSCEFLQCSIQYIISFSCLRRKTQRFTKN